MLDLEKCKSYAKKIRIFHGIEPEEVLDILKRGRMWKFEQGQTIFHEGTLGSNIFVVLDGLVDIHSKNTFIGRCEPGDAFGEMSVLNHRPRTASAIARTPVKVFTLDERQLNQVLEKKVAVRILLNIIHVLSERLENANLHIAERQLVRTD
jgi:CRP-like cAMP-binding protein